VASNGIRATAREASRFSSLRVNVASNTLNPYAVSGTTPGFTNPPGCVRGAPWASAPRGPAVILRCELPARSRGFAPAKAGRDISVTAILRGPLRGRLRMTNPIVPK
jgi:hypothetical protein